MSLNITDSYLNDFLCLTSVKILAPKLKKSEISAALEPVCESWCERLRPRAQATLRKKLRVEVEAERTWLYRLASGECVHGVFACESVLEIRG